MTVLKSQAHLTYNALQTSQPSYNRQLLTIQLAHHHIFLYLGIQSHLLRSSATAPYSLVYAAPVSIVKSQKT